MNKKTVLVAAAAMLSNIIREKMFNSYATFGPVCEAWIGSSAFSTALAVFISSFVALPGNYEDSSPPILFIYYMAMSILVTLLALKLLWMPVVDLLSELNMILSKTMLYVNKSFLCNAKSSCVKRVGTFLGTKTALIWSTNIVGLLVLYAVSSDLVHYIGMYICQFHRTGFLTRLKHLSLRMLSCVVGSMNFRRYILLKEKADFTCNTKKNKPGMQNENFRARKQY